MAKLIFVLVALTNFVASIPLQDEGSFVVSLKDPARFELVEGVQNDEAAIDMALLGNEGNVAEIYSLNVHSDIRFRYCRTQVISRVANRDVSGSREVVFQMVLPETAFISKFSIEMDGQVYEAYVKEKQEASTIYAQAKSRGQSAGLVEVNARHSNVFNVNLNVGSKSKVTFNLTYEELLLRKFNRYEHVININPEKFARIPDLQVTVNLHESQNITLLKVPALRNDTEIGNSVDEVIKKDVKIERPSGKSAVISWSPTLNERDQERWGLAGNDIRKFVVQYDITRESDAGEILLMNGYFVHFFAPKDVLPLRKHVVFVLDTSGSMNGRRIDQLKQAMSYVLDELKPDDYFSIIQFASSASVWKPSITVRDGSPLLASESNLRKAHEFITSLRPAGGTDIHTALVKALELIAGAQPSPTGDSNTTLLHKLPQSVESMVLFLTDGEPTVGVSNREQILAKIKQLNTESPVPIYSIGFGTGADFNFLKKLSVQNRAFARKVYEAADADIQMRGFYREVSSPLLSNITFKYTSDEYAVSKVTSRKFSNLLEGSEIAVAGLLRPKPRNGTLNVTEESRAGQSVMVVDIDANGRNGDVSFKKTEVQTPEGSDDYFLERLWAYLTIKQLLDEDSANNGVDETDDSGNDYVDADFISDPDSKEDLSTPIPVANKPVGSPKERAIKLALKYGFVTPITSLVVVKPNETVASQVQDPLFSQPEIEQYKAHRVPTAYQPILNARSGSSRSSYTATSGASISRNRALMPRGSIPKSSDSSHLSIPDVLDGMRSSSNLKAQNMDSILRPEGIEIAHYRHGPVPTANRDYCPWCSPTMSSSSHLSRSASKRPADRDSFRLATTPMMPMVQKERQRSWGRGSAENHRQLNEVRWLHDGLLLTKFIKINGTEYKVKKRSSRRDNYVPTSCVVKIGNNTATGVCQHLKDCVRSAFINNFSLYLTSYFCPIQISGITFAGSCCSP